MTARIINAVARSIGVSGRTSVPALWHRQSARPTNNCGRQSHAFGHRIIISPVILSRRENSAYFSLTIALDGPRRAFHLFLDHSQCQNPSRISCRLPPKRCPLDELVPVGFMNWGATWLYAARLLSGFLEIEREEIHLTTFPTPAFDTPEERARVAAILDTLQ